MSVPATAGLPEDTTLTGAYRLRWTAISPSDGSVATGVKVSDVSIFAEVLSGTADLATPLMLLPGTPSEGV